jgi:hypothetical protein
VTNENGNEHRPNRRKPVRKHRKGAKPGLKPSRRVTAKELREIKFADPFKRRVLFLEADHIGSRYPGGFSSESWDRLFDQDQVLGIRIGQTPQQHSIDHAKHSGGRADPEGQRKDGCCREAQAVEDTLTNQSMPPGGPFWTKEQLALYAKWRSDGYQP